VLRLHIKRITYSEFHLYSCCHAKGRFNKDRHHRCKRRSIGFEADPMKKIAPVIGERGWLFTPKHQRLRVWLYQKETRESSKWYDEWSCPSLTLHIDYLYYVNQITNLPSFSPTKSWCPYLFHISLHPRMAWQLPFLPGIHFPDVGTPPRAIMSPFVPSWRCIP
jgi:hypothetical protein